MVGASRRPESDPDGPGLPDLLHDAVEDLWPDDFEWMFLAGRSRTRDDFVVDLEKATAEVLSFQNRARKPADHSPHWGGPGVVLEEYSTFVGFDDYGRLGSMPSERNFSANAATLLASASARLASTWALLASSSARLVSASSLVRRMFLD